jgi:hypothetical protein
MAEVDTTPALMCCVVSEKTGMEMEVVPEGMGADNPQFFQDLVQSGWIQRPSGTDRRMMSGAASAQARYSRTWRCTFEGDKNVYVIIGSDSVRVLNMIDTMSKREANELTSILCSALELVTTYDMRVETSVVSVAVLTSGSEKNIRSVSVVLTLSVDVP